MSTSTETVPAALAELITGVMQLGRECPDIEGDILEIMLLVSQIQAFAGIDHGNRHAKQVIARLAAPEWEALADESKALLHRSAEAIRRACKLDERALREVDGSGPRPRASSELIEAGLEASLGRELAPEQIARLATVAGVLLRDLG